MKNRVFTIDEEETLQSVGTVYTVPPGHFIYMKGDPADKVYYVQKGRVRVFENLYSGREMTLDVVEAGRIFGESAFAEHHVRPASVQAVNQVTLISFRMKDVLPCFRSKAEFALHFLQLCSTILYPVILGVFETQPVGIWFSQDVLLSAVFAGVLMGCGIGLVIRAGGSTGGMDIPPCILQKLKGIPIGNSMVFFDMIILGLQILRGGMDGILYGIVVIILTSAMMNKTILSGEKKVELIIISSRNAEISKAILQDLDSGLTFLNIETGYRGEAQKAIFSVVYAKQYPAFRDRTLSIGPNAFIVAAPVMNVNGRGYTLAR